ncbi:hypothetical protein ABEB36_008233 [Hypothenemus hampei]|uniref:Peptidase S1 domain-containing protein n=1 Tax=Hypothenemus hampei TaxID=57062 RepID=A0ABD1EL68_HYPHA
MIDSQIIKCKMLRIVYICFLICILRCYNCYGTKDEGSHCQQLGLAGICKKVIDCPVALELLRKRRKHDLLRCGFSGLEEVVCCPDLSDRHPLIETSTLDGNSIWSGESDENSIKIDDRKTNNGKRKAELACDEIYKKNNIQRRAEFHIINGEDAETGQFPHMATLGVRDEFGNIDWKKCGGSLISSRFVLTAAHCVVCVDCNIDNVVKVRFGVIDIRDNRKAQDVDIKNIIVGNYNITSRHNDIALIELATDVKMSKSMYPACLYTGNDDPLGLLVSGWGLTDDRNMDSSSNILQFARLIAVPIEKCNSSLLARNRYTSRVIVDSQICAFSNTSDACRGDSGGPLQLMNKKGGYDLVGIVSYGMVCGSVLPGVYTRVSAYLDWIEKYVWPFEIN